MALVCTAPADGVTDATAAIQAAVNAGVGVIFPRGSYLISADITVSTSGIGLYFEQGAELKKGVNSINALNISGDFVLIQGATINGNAKTLGSGILVRGRYNRVLNCRVYDCAGTSSHGIALDGQATNCYSNLVQGCRVNAVGGIGISQNHSVDNRILDNDVQSPGLEGITVDNQCHRCLVSGNTIAGTCAAGGVGSIGIDYSDLVAIVGNTISGGALSAIKTQNNLGWSNFCSATGNVIVDPAGWGIWLYYNVSRGAANWTITGNVVRGAGSGSVRFEANCNNNTCCVNSFNAVAPSNAGAGNVIANNT